MEPTYRVISLGAGHQSTAMLLMADAGEIGPRPDIAIFADTGWEPQSIYKHLDWLESISTIPIVRVSIGRHLGLDTAAWIQHEGKAALSIPVFIRNRDTSTGMIQHRQCTARYKIEPIEQYCRKELFHLHKGQRMRKGESVEKWIGISTDEELWRKKESRDKWQVNRWPLIEQGMSRNDCKKWFADRYPGQVLPRSACAGCPFRSDAEWLDVKQNDPKDFAEAVRIDQSMRDMREERGFTGQPFLHKRVKPVDKAVEEYELQLAMNPMMPGLESGWGQRMCWSVFYIRRGNA